MTFCQDIYRTLCERHPNSNIYIISDQHFYHRNILNYTRSEFSDVEEMNSHIINAHNSTIGESDIVIFLGDFCLKKPLIPNILSKLNGHKYLLLGNHDPEVLEKNYLALGFEGVYTTPVKIGDAYLSHEPLVKGEHPGLTFQEITKEFSKNSNARNYHGHIHTKDNNISPSYINSTCEALGYVPILIGRTKETEEEDLPLFINSKYFSEAIKEIQEKYGIDTRLLMDDYIYSMMLEALSRHHDETFLQGSFGLFKKYGFISKFSDLDVSCIYDSEKSKHQNFAIQCAASNEVYEHLKSVSGINLEFLKRYKSLHLFRASLLRPTTMYSQTCLDINLIPLECYRKTDFKELKGRTTIERYLFRNSSPMLKDYSFPQFHVQAINSTGDISNLILQILFQQGFEDKKVVALKKLLYVYKRTNKDELFENFLDTFIRLFLRNIALLSSWNRTQEIDYIKERVPKLKSTLEPFVDSLPKELKEHIYEVLTNPNSEFLRIYEELKNTPTEKSLEGCAMILKQIKK